MGYYRFSEDEIIKINARLDEMTTLLKARQKTDPHQVWFDNQEFIQIMNISKRTAAYWRTEKIVSYSQVGNKIYYRLSDILDLLNKNIVSASDSFNSKNLTDGNLHNFPKF